MLLTQKQYYGCSRESNHLAAERNCLLLPSERLSHRRRTDTEPRLSQIGNKVGPTFSDLLARNFVETADQRQRKNWMGANAARRLPRMCIMPCCVSHESNCADTYDGRCPSADAAGAGPGRGQGRSCAGVIVRVSDTSVAVMVVHSGLHPNFPPVSRVRRLVRPSWGVFFVASVSSSSQFFRPPFTL